MNEIINPIIGVLFAGALAYFLYGLAIYVINSGDPGKRKDGQNHMQWGLIGLAVMVSAWGLIQLSVNTFGFGGTLF